MNLHKLAYVHHHSMYIRRHMLRWVDVDEHTDKFDFCSNSLLVCSDKSQGRTDNNLLIFKSFATGFALLRYWVSPGKLEQYSFFQIKLAFRSSQTETMIKHLNCL